MDRCVLGHVSGGSLVFSVCTKAYSGQGTWVCLVELAILIYFVFVVCFKAEDQGLKGQFGTEWEQPESFIESSRISTKRSPPISVPSGLPWL